MEKDIFLLPKLSNAHICIRAGMCACLSHKRTPKAQTENKNTLCTAKRGGVWILTFNRCLSHFSWKHSVLDSKTIAHYKDTRFRILCRNGQTNRSLNHLSTCSLLFALWDAVRPQGRGKNIHTVKLWVRIAGQVIDNNLESKYFTEASLWLGV